MPSSHHHYLVLLLLIVLGAELPAVSGEQGAACDVQYRQEDLRPDRLTVLLSGYSERRLPLLRAISGAYAAHPLVLAVIVLWCNPSTPDDRLLFPRFPPRVSLHRAASSSLNSRFLPHASIRTAAVAVADDDVLPDAAAISFAFAAWQQQRPGALVGFFPRSHRLDLACKRWAYAAPQPGPYSMVLSELPVLGVDLIHKCSCSPELAAVRAVVDRERNWGDPRNDSSDSEEGGTGTARR